MKLFKNVLLLCVSFLISNGINAQKSGVINYQETMKLKFELDDAPAGVDLAGMMPTERSVTKQLIFDNNESLYVDGGEAVEDTEITSDDGSIQIVFGGSEIESRLYTDFENKTSLDQQGFMGKAFIIDRPVEKIKWKITPEKVKYLDYECMKATMTDEEGVETVAWFAPAIPVKAGPAGYGQLPGAILMLSKGDKDLEIKATSIELKEIKAIEKPNDGKKVSEEEFDKIVEEKMKEMEKEYGGKGIMIRG